MSTEALQRDRWERLLSVFARLRPGEGRSVAYFMTYGFLVMFCYYMLKTLRETLLLSQATAEMKSYAYAVIALILLFVVPIYGALYRRLPNRELNVWIAGILLAVQFVFFFLSHTGLNIGFAYYVWVGIFGVLITAQFWAFAADTFNVKAGQRLFPLIMIGVSLGGLVGPALAGRLLQTMGPPELMYMVMVVLAFMLPMTARSRDAVPPSARSVQTAHTGSRSEIPGGFAYVLRNHYLLLIAAMVVLLNWVNTTGEYILAEFVLQHADALIAEDPRLDKSHIIAGFYGNFFALINALSLVIQLFFVARLIEWLGVNGTLLIVPIIALIGYGLMVFIPVFTMIRLVKILEDTADYSVMNTARQSLFLPLSAAETYQSKIAIDGFFWRFGDLIQALAIYVGLHLYGLEAQHFAALNMVLALVWFGLAMLIGRRYLALKKQATLGEPPSLLQVLRPHPIPPGSRLDYQLPMNLFHCEPGDMLEITVRSADGDKLPGWLKFDPESWRFYGIAPIDLYGNTWLTVRATNIDGQWVETRLGFIHQ